MRDTFKALAPILGQWLEEHRTSRASREVSTESDEQDITSILLSLQEEGQLRKTPYDVNTSIKSTCLAMILGGDGVAILMIWVVVLLLNSRGVLNKAQ
ncbi:hypothetical protein CDL15_Pgr003971 [Punica granatum]|nr:hypothetical protein CDL15_Pgr003971 [Punica granatum]